MLSFILPACSALTGTAALLASGAEIFLDAEQVAGQFSIINAFLSSRWHRLPQLVHPGNLSFLASGAGFFLDGSRLEQVTGQFSNIHALFISLLHK